MTASLTVRRAVSKAGILNCLVSNPISTLQSHFSTGSFNFPPGISIVQLFGDEKTTPTGTEEHQPSKERWSGWAFALEQGAQTF